MRINVIGSGYMGKQICSLFDVLGYDVLIWQNTKENLENHISNQKHNLEFKAVDKDYLSHIQWPETHPEVGSNIELRDYQVDTINKFIKKNTTLTDTKIRNRLYSIYGTKM